jgi:hypothetical protein
MFKSIDGGLALYICSQPDLSDLIEHGRRRHKRNNFDINLFTFLRFPLITLPWASSSKTREPTAASPQLHISRVQTW